jgi:gliding motility-associated-like protein
MKPVTSLVLFLFCCIFLPKMNAQNIVPNYSFEDHTGLPMGYGEWNHAVGWDNVNNYIGFMYPYASPDYLHDDGGFGVNLPATTFANVNAHDGDAIFGFVAYIGYEPDFREYLSAELTEPMIPGASYTVSFWITSGESGWYGGAGSNHVGIQFSEGPLTQADHEPVGGIPQIEIPGIYWSDEWELFTYTYVADAPYTRITIGNFYDDSDTDVSAFGVPGATVAYYFVDEVAVVPLTVTTIIDTTICDGNIYTLPDGTTTNAAGSYTIVLAAADGSDSTVITNLTISPVYDILVDVTLCAGETYVLPDGVTVDVAGTYITNLLTALACDSIITTNLEIIPFFTSTTDTSICDGESFVLPDGIIVTDAGEYESVLISAGGCDSIVTTNLAITEVLTASQDISICFGASYILPDGVVVTDEGTYTSVITAVSGCDSIVITNLLVVTEINTNIVADICEGDNYMLPDGTLTGISGTYNFIFTSVGGCDSIVTTTLNVHPLPIATFILQDIICIEATPLLLEASPSGGTYSGTGIIDNTFDPELATVGGPYLITYIVADAFGCSDTITAAIEVQENTADAGADTTIMSGETAILLGSAGGDYVWSPNEQMNCFDCAITEVNPFFTTTYTLTSVDLNGCIATDDVTVFVEGSVDVIIPNAFSANNDGINDVYHIILYGATLNYFNIYNRWGELVYSVSNSEVNWDGSFNGQALEIGTYVYATEYVSNGVLTIKSGSITLLR